MDKYEVTVARLKQYLTWYFGPEGSAPAPGAGKSPHFAADPGWNSNYPLPARNPQGMQDAQDMLSCVAVHGDPADVNATYPAANPLLPANCVSFYVADALCIWDGGRLPTEAEWNFAATSSEQRTYPWSNPPASTLINATYAVYANNPILSVGSLPAGVGPFGQLDLAGNVSEWTLDYFTTSYPAAITPCADCINLSPTAERSLRGGSFQFSQLFVKTSSRGSLAPDMGRVFAGFRCVHDL
jgi:formylglycine-generating enzyme required for sulfatase activity